MSRDHSPTVTTQTFSALVSLGLDDSDLDALARQGTVIADRSGPSKNRYKLRFRVDGRQRVKYLGGEGQFLGQVRRELAVLQRRTKTRRRHRRLRRVAMACLRRTKAQIEPVLECNGYRFHGREVRRVRERFHHGGNRNELTTETQYRSIIMDEFGAQTAGPFTKNDAKKRRARKPENDQLHQNLNEMRLSSQEKTNPMQKLALGAFADLMQVAGAIADAIKDEFENRQPNLREAQEALPTIKGWTSLHRQAYRYAKLDCDSGKTKAGDTNQGLSTSQNQAEKCDSVT